MRIYRNAICIPLFGLAACLITGGCSTDLPTDQTRHAIAEVAEADRQYNLGHVDQGRDWLNKAVALSSDKSVYFGDSDGNKGFLDVANDHGDFDEIVTVVSKAVKTPPLATDSDIFEFYGDALQHLGRNAAYKAAYAQMLVNLKREYPSPGSRTPAGKPVQLSEAEAEWQSGDIPSARRDFDTVRRLYPDFASDASNSEAYFAAVDGIDLDKALKLATQAVAKAESLDNSVVLSEYEDTLGWVYYRLAERDRSKADVDLAVSNLELAVAAFPFLGDIHWHLAEAYLAEGKTDDAAIEFNKLANMWVADKSAQADAKKYTAKVEPITLAEPFDSTQE